MIPARLGSKRIPKKNIRYMIDKPLIQYPIDLCVNSNLFEGVWVNTEYAAIAPVIEKMGASFHERPKELATDTATNRQFTYEFLKRHDCDYVIMVNPTSPLLREKTLLEFADFIQKGEYDTVLSVVSEKSETFFRGTPLNFSLEEKVNSQLLEPVDKIVWALTAWKRETFINLEDSGKNPVFGGKVAIFSIPKDESCDLDTPEDWNIAEGILNARISGFAERYMRI